MLPINGSPLVNLIAYNGARLTYRWWSNFSYGMSTQFVSQFIHRNTFNEKLRSIANTLAFMPKQLSLLILLLLMSLNCHAQWPFKKEEKDKKDKLKVYQSSRGLLLGYERGRMDMIQVGYHYNWKKVRLQKPVIRATEAFLEYAPFNNVLGAKVTYWQRLGRLKFTYGGHAGYFTDFDEGSLSIGPSVGFRLLGFHGQLGYNLLANREVDANRLYVSVSFFIPQHSKLFYKKGEKEKKIFNW